ncbi:carboxymuconolactone decarboxylase family protein [Streptomyces sp. NPDC006012]|uniref:carboxymuconolactone decarboxylase family protein n=1 Tax=Streptomyces sp. NPDC006012 TaxID=3364739 RepID=UPI0036A9B4D2
MAFLPVLPADATVLDVLKTFPEPAGPLVDYHQVVLRGPSELTVAERELIAAFVSALNSCRYCRGVHEAVAERFGIEHGVLAALLADLATAPVRDAMKPLFAYVRKLTVTPGRMTAADAEAVLAAGWQERTLYDAVSVCALFNLMNRIVEGLGVRAPDDDYFAVAARRLSRDDGFADYRGLVPRAHDHDA